MQQTTHHNLSYWNESFLAGQLPAARANRYIIFDVDQGGWNNIRLAFEYVAVLAAITGRTLVLPPRSSWYLINFGPLPDEHKGGTSEFADFLNIAALKTSIQVLSTSEFIDVAKSHLNIPEEFEDAETWSSDCTEINQAWGSWLLKNTEIPGWNPYDTVICHPDIESAQAGPHMREAYLDGRQQVELTPRMNAAPILYFPSTAKYRSLGPVATMLASADDSLPSLARRFIKYHIRYSEEIFELANRILQALELDSFDAMQIRRNDFQYTQTRIGTEEICNNIGVLFDQNLVVYIASDEDRKEIFDELAIGLNAPKIFSWKDVEAVIDEPIPFAWIGPIEQLICSAARRFVGTDLSTFTSYINRLRGYMLAVDQNLYFHNQRYSELPEPTLIENFRGRDYLRENPLFWVAC
ncbi:MAG: hypothetical protein ACI9FR_002125 [Cryomorphaceae bacterium]|jgi:hypothetical protein